MIVSISILFYDRSKSNSIESGNLFYGCDFWLSQIYLQKYSRYQKRFTKVFIESAFILLQQQHFKRKNIFEKSPSAIPFQKEHWLYYKITQSKCFCSRCRQVALRRCLLSSFSKINVHRSMAWKEGREKRKILYVVRHLRLISFYADLRRYHILYTVNKIYSIINIYYFA